MNATVGQTPFEILARYERLSLAHASGTQERLEAPGLWRGIGYRAGNRLFVSGIEEINELLAVPSLTQVPGTKPWLLGVANVRSIPSAPACWWCARAAATWHCWWTKCSASVPWTWSSVAVPSPRTIRGSAALSTIVWMWTDSAWRCSAWANWCARLTFVRPPPDGAQQDQRRMGRSGGKRPRILNWHVLRPVCSRRMR